MSTLDLIPNGWRDVPTDALLWWLQNPLLLHLYPGKIAATAKDLPGMTLKEQQRVLWALRGVRAKARATKPRPAECLLLSKDDLEELYAEIKDGTERSDIRRFAQTLHSIEYGWLIAKVRETLALRLAESPAAAELITNNYEDE